MISTRDLSELPGVPVLLRLLQSLAALDAIMSPDREYRYHSFDARWAEGRQLGSMRSGSGDGWFALFTPAGAGIVGSAHEAPMFRPGRPTSGIFDGLPAGFAELAAEPAFAPRDATFCIWRRIEDRAWSMGLPDFPPGPDPDGSARLLAILDGNPETYRRFASGYYQIPVPLSAVRSVYRHEPMTDAMVRRLNAASSLLAVDEDLAEIGYPRGA